MNRRAEFDESRRSMFGAEAEAYGDGRPGYPTELVDQLRTSCGLLPGSAVLEIGPGAGQATHELLHAGATVTAVELASEFCEMLETTFRDQPLRVIQSEFEGVDLPAESFDVVVAATSFHWIEPISGLRRVADLLRPNGALALWWTHYGDDDRPDPFRESVQPILERHAPHLTDDATGGAGIGAHPYALDVDARTDEVETSGRFGPVSPTLIPWTAALTATEVRRFFASFSQWMALETATREALLDEIEGMIVTEFNGIVERPYLTALYTARRL